MIKEWLEPIPASETFQPIIHFFWKGYELVFLSCLYFIFHILLESKPYWSSGLHLLNTF